MKLVVSHQSSGKTEVIVKVVRASAEANSRVEEWLSRRVESEK
jgi:hypothetical protein